MGYEWSLSTKPTTLPGIPETPSIGYQVVARLAAKAESILLLSATPEQTGERRNRFSRLQLLDADRYHDFDHAPSPATSIQTSSRIGRSITYHLAKENSSPEALDWNNAFGPYLKK